MEKEARMAAAAQTLALGQAACSSKAMLLSNAWQPAGQPVCHRLPNRTQIKDCVRDNILTMAPQYVFVHKIKWLEHPTAYGKWT